jgi:hypothetical protein
MRSVTRLVAMVVLAVGLTASPAQAWNECEAPGPQHDSGYNEVVVYAGDAGLYEGGTEIEPDRYGNIVGVASHLGYVEVGRYSHPGGVRVHGRTKGNSSPVDVSFDVDSYYGGVCLDVEGETVRIRTGPSEDGRRQGGAW